MPMILSDPLQTLARAYQDICAGEDAWVALGNFSNEWFVYAVGRREELVAEPPVVPVTLTQDLQRWAAFIAASAEYLCQQGEITCPSWVHDASYCLETPWYDVPRVTERLRAWLEKTTPEPFSRRNIYCGDRIYLDKEQVVARSA